jgi:glutamyl-tRNA synthetase
VIRGDDHVNNTPRQINIMTALGGTPPVFAHLPTVLTPEGEKLSKRHGAKGVLQYRDDGYLPEAVVNYLARLGWAHGDDEIFTREQFLGWFDLAGLASSPGRFDPDKLRWVNEEQMKRLDQDELGRRLVPYLARPASTAAGPAQSGRRAAARPRRHADRDGRRRPLFLRHDPPVAGSSRSTSTPPAARRCAGCRTNSRPSSGRARRWAPR